MLDVILGEKARDAKCFNHPDPDFKDKADKARLSGKGIKADLANLKDISFEDFSEQFLDTKLFDHHKSWIDLVEGKEPRFIHPSMTYEQAATNRILINVPPEHAKSTVLTINYVNGNGDFMTYYILDDSGAFNYYSVLLVSSSSTLPHVNCDIWLKVGISA